MPQGLCNAPSVHQHCMTMALQKFIRWICHIYLDDIIIWSDNLKEHKKHIKIIMDTLTSARLYCNPKKSSFFLTELVFLGHRISTEGIKVCSSKAKKILNWPTPKTATEVWWFLWLVWYLAAFLLNLADQTRILTPLTMKECEKNFPFWTDEFQHTFDTTKALIASWDCLMVIDHVNQ